MKRGVILSAILFFFLPRQVDAAGSYTLANYYPIIGKVREGTIISISNGKYTLSNSPYDQFIVGAVTGTPAVTQKINSPIPYYPVVDTGEGYVLVSTINGQIKKGDYITSSRIPGVGQKAAESGNTIGIAQSDFTEVNKNKIKMIPMIINIHYVSSTDGKQINNSAYSGSFKPAAMLGLPDPLPRILIAFVIIIIAFFLAFQIVIKSANKGIEALGRNPMASRQIYVGLAFIIFIAFVIIFVGFTTGSLILKL